MQQIMNEEIQIDIKEIFQVFIKKAWIIIFVGIVCALGTGLYSSYVMNPIYTSSTKIYVINRQNKGTTTYADLQTGTQLTMDYKILVLSRSVTEQVISNLNLNMTHNELISSITVNIPQNTRILEIFVRNKDPEVARKIADCIASISAERMVSIMEMEKVNIIDSANLPTIPSSPDVKKNIIIGGIVGIIISTILVYVFYFMNDSIKNSEDIEKHLGLNILATIPLHYKKITKNKSSSRKKNIRKKRNHKEDTNNVINDEKSRINFASNEAYKTLRTNIMFCGKEIKTICITSSLPNEGKTDVSFQLSKTIAEGGKKVLFIDADLRESVLLNRLKIENTVYGLSQYLSGMNGLEDIINNTNIENLDIIFTGQRPPNPSEMLESDSFKELIRVLRTVYDFILIDTPPLGLVIDAANVAETCDGTIIVIESNKTSYKLAQGVLEQLKKGECRVLGVVLNKVDINPKGYYKKYYGKYYKS